MKLFTKDIDTKLFEQYAKGSDLNNQMVVAKIFNPYGNGTWYLLNSDPEDPEYLWAIVDMGDIEVGSVNRSDLENIRIRPFMLGLERDLSFRPVNALELYKGLQSGKQYAKGGGVGESVKSYKYGFDTFIDVVGTNYGGKLVLGRGKVKGVENVYLSHIDWDDNNVPENSDEIEEYVNENLDNLLQNAQKYNNGGNVGNENAEMVKSYNKQIAHHTKEMNEAINKNGEVPAWVVAKMTRSASDLSDATHYMEGEGESYAIGGGVEYKMKMVSFPEDKTYKYYVVEEDKDNYLTVQEDMFDKWKNANQRERAEYYSEWIPKTEMIEVMANGGVSKKEFIAKKIGKVMKEFKEGDLHIGTSNKIVKNPKQAIAIGLSEGNKGWKHRKK